MNQRLKTQTGITLIALIITVILLLILLGVALKTTVDGKLFGRAKEAVDKTNLKVGEVQGEVNRLLDEWDRIENGSSGGNTGGNNTTGGNTSGGGNNTGGNENEENPIVNRSYLRVGEYIDYTPDKAGDYSLSMDITGLSKVDANLVTQDTTLKWRILNINDDGTVDIISEQPTNGRLYLNGAVGYNNGVFLLNDICKKHYSNQALGVTARSINLADIEKHFTSEGVDARNKYYSNGKKYGDTLTVTNSDYTYTPDIYNYVSKDTAGESVDYYTAVSPESYRQESKVDVKQTFYKLAVKENHIDDNIVYLLLFGDTLNSSYWLASRATRLGGAWMTFCMRMVECTELAIYAEDLYESDNSKVPSNNYLRPIVRLNADVKISELGGTETMPRTLSR